MTNSIPKPSTPQTVFAIFAGGGAKGLAHLGAASAADELSIEFIGVAGASAGAFVAALLAGGYRGADLFDPNNPKNDVLSRLEYKPLDLLGDQKWLEALEVLDGAKTALNCVLRQGKYLAYYLGGKKIRRTLSIIRRGAATHGHFTTETIRSVVNLLLQEKVKEAHAKQGLPTSKMPDRVRFKDLDYREFRQFRPLKIIATDITECMGTVFSLETTPDVEVGEAVAASIAIPIAFQPVKMVSFPDRGPFVDGGLVSNLPTWLFSEEKLAIERRNPNDKPIPTLAFTLAANREGEAERGARGTNETFARQLVYAAIFGGQQTPQQFLDDLFIMPLGTDLTTMKFDASLKEARKAVLQGRLDALSQIRRRLQITPQKINAELERLRGEFVREVNNARSVRGASPLKRVRAALIAPWGRRSLRVVHSSGMGLDVDDRLLLDRDGPGAATVFRTRNYLTVRLERSSSGAPRFPEAALMTRYEEALLWSGMKSMICIPIYDDATLWKLEPDKRPICDAALSLDSDDDLGDDWTETLRAWIVEKSVALGKGIALKELGRAE